MTECEVNYDVLDVSRLTGGLPWLQALFDDFKQRPKILKYLHWRRARTRAATLSKPRIFTDEEELKQM